LGEYEALQQSGPLVFRNPFYGRENLRPFAEIGEFRLTFLLLLQSFLIGTGVAFTLLWVLTVADHLRLVVRVGYT
jgi:hypothetical protein